jgi:hypothetical protein
VFGKEYFRALNAQDTTRLLEYKKIMAFQACLVQLIACIRVGRTIVEHGMVSSKARKKIAQLVLKPWPTMRLGFDIIFWDA